MVKSVPMLPNLSTLENAIVFKGALQMSRFTFTYLFTLLAVTETEFEGNSEKNKQATRNRKYRRAAAKPAACAQNR